MQIGSILVTVQNAYKPKELSFIAAFNGIIQKIVKLQNFSICLLNVCENIKLLFFSTVVHLTYYSKENNNSSKF
jgi:hypothetical protein